VGKLLAKTRDVMKELSADGVKEDEVVQAKEYLQGSFALSASTLGAIASRWLGGYLFDLGPDYLNEFVPKISAVNPAEVSAALAKGYEFDRAAVVVAGDAKTVVPALKSAGFANVRVVTVKQLM
jgi:zinc protease